MANFIFKVPDLPEDVLMRKRKPDNNHKLKDLGESWEGNSSSSRGSMMSRIGRPCYPQLQSISGGYKDERMQPSTSRCTRILGNREDNVNIFQGSFGRFGNQYAGGSDLRGSYNNDINRTRESEVNSVFSSKACLPKMSSSVFGNRTSNYFNLTHNGDLNSVGRQGLKIPLHTNQEVCRRLNQHNYFGNRTNSNTSSIESSCSSMSMRQSLFHTGLLHGQNRYPRDFSISNYRNQSNHSVNRTCVSQRGTLPFNASQSVLQKQTMMASFIQSTVKEQVMNALENFQHSLVLSNAPALQTLFEKTAKEVKSIFEDSVMYMNGDVGTMDVVSTLDYTSETSRLPQKSIMESDKQVCQPDKKPNEIFRHLKMGRNESVKIEIAETFMQEKKQSSCTRDDDIENVGITSSSLQINVKRSINRTKSKDNEVKQKDWEAHGNIVNSKNNNNNNNRNKDKRVKKLKESISSPVKTHTRLSGGHMVDELNKKNDDSRILTTTRSGRVVKRPGNPMPGGTQSSEMSVKINNEIQSKCKFATKAIKGHQNSEKENEGAVLRGDKSWTAKHRVSLSTPIRATRNSSTLTVEVEKSRDSNDSVLRHFISPVAAKTVTMKTNPGDEGVNEGASKHGDKKRNGNKENRVGKLERGQPTTNSAPSNVKPATEDSAIGDGSSRVLTTTRSGRIVKRPGNLWIGGHFNSTDTGNDVNCKSSSRNKSKSNSDSSEDNNEKEVSRLKRKRDVSDKTVIEVKKSKAEKSKDKWECHPTREQPAVTSKSHKKKEKPKTKSVNDNQPCEVLESPVATKRANGTKRNGAREPAFSAFPNPFGNEIEEGLDDIFIPEITSHAEEVITNKKKKLKMLTMETPPLKFLRSHLRILNSCTPDQSPNWQISQHTQSEVKKFEKLRAQTFKQKIPKENNKKTTEKRVNNSARNKDVDTIVNWFGEREVKSPKQCSKVIKYMIPKSSELENEDEEDDV